MGSIRRNLFLSFPVRFLQLDQLDTWPADGAFMSIDWQSVLASRNGRGSFADCWTLRWSSPRAVSSAELLRLLSREQLTPAASEVEELQVKNQPRMMRARRTPRKDPPGIRPFGFNRFHIVCGTTNRLRAVRHARYEAVVRFAHPTGGRYRSHPFDGYQNALTEASGRGR